MELCARSIKPLEGMTLSGSHSRLAAPLFHNLAWVFVLAQSDKLRMPQPVDLRFILLLFMAWAAKPETIGLLNLESA